MVEQNTYDGSGMRVKKVIGGQTTYYLYNGVDPIMEYTPGNGQYTYHIYAGNTLVADEVNGIPIFYHHDHLGSTRLVTNSSGTAVTTYKFTPYGETDTHTGADTKYGFTGKEGEVETGLTYFGARYYDPVMGRFISVDPIRLE